MKWTCSALLLLMCLLPQETLAQAENTPTDRQRSVFDESLRLLSNASTLWCEMKVTIYLAPSQPTDEPEIRRYTEVGKVSKPNKAAWFTDGKLVRMVDGNRGFTPRGVGRGGGPRPIPGINEDWYYEARPTEMAELLHETPGLDFFALPGYTAEQQKLEHWYVLKGAYDVEYRRGTSTIPAVMFYLQRTGPGPNRGPIMTTLFIDAKTFLPLGARMCLDYGIVRTADYTRVDLHPVFDDKTFGLPPKTGG